MPHNHELLNPDLEKYLDVGPNTEKMYTDSFSEGITPSEALENHKKTLLSMGQEKLLADRSIVPSKSDVYR